MMESIGDSAEELHSVEQGKQIYEALFSRPVWGLRAQTAECMSAELSVENDSWNYCECSVSITNSFVLSAA